MANILSKLLAQYWDVKHFGPAVIERFFHKSDANGYSTVKTQFGLFLVRRFDTDMRVLREIFIGGDYDLSRFPQGKLVRSAYEDTLRRGKVPLIIDAGANAGFATRFFARAYPHARIVAVEPDPGNAAICRANTKALPLVEVVEAAIGSRPGHVSIERQEGHSWSVRTHRAEAGLPVVTIGELQSRVAESELLIVKVDIEGFELDLFSTATEWIAQTHTVIVEPHDWLMLGDATSRTLQRAMLGEDRDVLIVGENLAWIKRQG